MGRFKKRRPEIVILSDIHLGTYGCHAEELLRYHKTIKPKKIILNGDIGLVGQKEKDPVYRVKPPVGLAFEKSTSTQTF
jgi:hypothetical protein